MTELTLAIVGGGVSVARLCEDLAASDVLPRMRIRLTARRWDRLCVIAEHCRLLVETRKPTWSLTAEESLRAALADADAVILLMRVGGAAARAKDEQFPRHFGLPGDEGLGPGGIANALRTLPVLEGACEVIAASAPRALILNMMAPLGVTTRLLVDEGLDAIGICELPLVTEALLQRATGSHSGADLDFAGFNHLGWFWPSTAEQDAAFFRRIVDAGLANQKTVAEFIAAPLRYYYEMFDPAAAEMLGFRRSPCRASEVQAIADRSVADFAAAPGRSSAALYERSTPWFKQALVPILEALFAGKRHEGFLNIRNGDLISELPADVVVELRATITLGGTMITPPSRLPPKVKTFLEGIALSEQCAFRASRTTEASEKKDLVKRALAALPYSEPIARLVDLTDAVLHASRS